MAEAGAAHPWTGEGPRSSRDWRVWDIKKEFHSTLLQLEELRQQLEQQEEELGRLRLGVVCWGRCWERARGVQDFHMGPKCVHLCQGATDSEKRVQHLTLENEALKQSLNLTRDLLLHWGPGPPTRAPQVSCFLVAALPTHLASATVPKPP